MEDIPSKRFTQAISRRSSGLGAKLSGWLTSAKRPTTETVDSTIRIVRMTLHSMNNGLGMAAIYWPAVIIGAGMVAVTSGQGLFLGVVDAKLKECGAQVTETMLLADAALVVGSGLLLLGIIGWRCLRGTDDESDEAGESAPVVSCMRMPKVKVIKFLCVGAMGTVDNIMYLQAMSYHNPAAVMILRLACSLVILTLGQMALRMLKSSPIQVFGLLPLVLSAVTHILAAAGEKSSGSSGKPAISTNIAELIVLILCPFTAAAEVLGTDLLFAEKEAAEGEDAPPEPEPHQVLAFMLNSMGAALMDAIIHLGFNSGQFPIRSFGCTESALLIGIAAMYVLTYKMAMVLCGGMASVVLRVLNPMVTYVATCLVLQVSPKLKRSVSGLTVLGLVAWYNISPIWDAHMALAAKRQTIAAALTGIEGNLRKSRAAAARKSAIVGAGLHTAESAIAGAGPGAAESAIAGAGLGTAEQRTAE